MLLLAAHFWGGCDAEGVERDTLALEDKQAQAVLVTAPPFPHVLKEPDAHYITYDTGPGLWAEKCIYLPVAFAKSLV